MKRWIVLSVMLALPAPALAETYTLPATSSQLLLQRESEPSASQPRTYDPLLAAGLNYVPGLALGALVNLGVPGASLSDRLLILAGLTLANPFAGLGQWYVDEPTRGNRLMAANVLASTAAATGALAAGIAGTRDTAQALGVVGLLLLPVGISAWAAFDAHRLAEEKNAKAGATPSAGSAQQSTASH